MGDSVSGWGHAACWRCMKRAPRDRFGSVRTTREEFESWGEDAWWMHEGCMTGCDWAKYTGDDVPGDAQGSHPSDTAGAQASLQAEPTMTPAMVVPEALVSSIIAPQEVMRMSVRQLKEFLTARGVPCGD